jgi:hypothetical protein
MGHFRKDLPGRNNQVFLNAATKKKLSGRPPPFRKECWECFFFKWSRDQEKLEIFWRQGFSEVAQCASNSRAHVGWCMSRAVDAILCRLPGPVRSNDVVEARAACRVTFPGAQDRRMRRDYAQEHRHHVSVVPGGPPCQLNCTYGYVQRRLIMSSVCPCPCGFMSYICKHLSAGF